MNLTIFVVIVVVIFSANLVIVVKALCFNGRSAGGAQWYLGASGDPCRRVCAKQRSDGSNCLYDPLTCSWGYPSNCLIVGNLFGSYSTVQAYAKPIGCYLNTAGALSRGDACDAEAKLSQFPLFCACYSTDCGYPPSIPNSTNSCPAASTTGSVCSYVCNNGYVPSPSGSYATCGGTPGIWTLQGSCVPGNPCLRPDNTASTIYNVTCPYSIPHLSSCTPICQTGYTASGSLTINCYNGGFSSPAGVCVPNPCRRPDNTESTIFAQTSCPSPTLSGSICTPSCAYGYSLNGTTLQMACFLGNLSVPSGICSPDPCAIPSDSLTTIFSVNCPSTVKIPSGSSCTPTCVNGYYASDDLMITCKAGAFSSPRGICLPNPCAPSAVPYPLTLGGCESVIPSSSYCFLSCDSDYIANGSLIVQCDRGNLSAPTSTCILDESQNKCTQATPPYPKTPGNCPFHALQGQSCELGCIPGYSPSSPVDFLAVCTNRTFLYNSTTICLENSCVAADLPLLQGMSNGDCGLGTPLNSYCSISCKQGYLPVGSLVVFCLAGNYSNPTGHCQPKSCLQPDISSSSFLTLGTCQGQTASGDYCTLSCIDGYSNLGSMNISCFAGSFIDIANIGYCVGVANISTSASSLPFLVASPGAKLDVVLSTILDPSAFFVNNMTIKGSYASDFRMPEFVISSTSTNLVVDIVVFVSVPMLYLFNYPLSNSIHNATYMSPPKLSDVCPHEIRTQVVQTVIVRGLGFVQCPTIRCALDGKIQDIPPLSVDPTSVTCKLYYANDTVGGFAFLNVVNDGVPPLDASQGLPLTLLGACQSGKPGSVAGPSGCECPKGTQDKGSECTPCDNGSFQSETNKFECEQCSENEDTNGITGCMSSSCCVCMAGFFPHPQPHICHNCVDGMECLGNNEILINPGFWRKNNNTIAVLHCPSGEDSCSGTKDNSDDLCNEGYKGPLCNVCKQNYARIGLVCQKCTSKSINYLILAIYAVAGSALLYFFIKTANTVSSERASQNLGPTVKIAMNFLQVLYFIGKLSANWSAVATYFFAVIGGGSALSPDFIAVQCAFTWSFYEKLVVVYLSPAMVVIFLWLIYTIRHFLFHKKLKETRDDLQFAIMLLLYLIHPTIMLEVVSSLRCENIPGTGTSYLRTDMRVDCQKPIYYVFATMSVVYLIVYVFGMIVIILVRGLYHNAKTGKLFIQSHPANIKYSFFVRGYRNEVYYWEGVVLMRKLIITALSILLNPSLQLIYAAVVLTFSLHYTITLTPFSNSFINRLETISLLCLNITVVLGMHYLAIPSHQLGTTIVLFLVDGSWICYLIFQCLSKLREAAVDKLSKFSLLSNLRTSVEMADTNGKSMEQSLLNTET